jgi:hypothetical protein
MVIGGRRYPSKAILAWRTNWPQGQNLGLGDFEGGKGGAADVLGKPGFKSGDDPAGRVPARPRPAPPPGVSVGKPHAPGPPICTH